MKLKHLFLSITIVLLGACSSEDEPAVPVLTLQSSEVAALVEGGEYTIEVSSSSPWNVSAAPGWVEWEVSAAQDKLTLTVDENLERNPRSGQLALANEEGLTQTVTLTQEAYSFSEGHHYKLPVVFHVLYWNQNNTQHNVKAGQLQKIMDRVNYYYQNCGAEIPLEFVMATEDPEGNRLEEPGVSREKWQYTTMDCSSFMGSGKQEYKDLLWDTSKYINVVLYNFSDELVMGIAQFPWVPEPFYLEGAGEVKKGVDPDSNPYPQCVSLNNKYIYDLPDEGDTYSMSNVAATLAHELGHFLGLYHAFNQELNGNNNSNRDTDYCTDTPPYNKYQYDLVLTNYFAYNPEITSKSSDAYKTYVMRTNSATGQKFRSDNIMDYAISDANRFSAEQATRVKYILHHALFVPGPKDYSGTDFVTRSNSDFRFTPQFIE